VFSYPSHGSGHRANPDKKTERGVLEGIPYDKVGKGFGVEQGQKMTWKDKRSIFVDTRGRGTTTGLSSYTSPGDQSIGGVFKPGLNRQTSQEVWRAGGVLRKE